jgi:hypothetical protein
MQITIRSGGQSGVDRAALDVALREGLPYGGWCPRGGWAEDYSSPPGLLTLYPRLIETPSARPEQRTAWNVRDSHATVILVRGDELARSPGTQFTQLCAELIFLRPCLVADISRPEALAAAHRWLSQVASGLDVVELVLNVAGPRESQAPGIYAEAKEFLSRLLTKRIPSPRAG